MRQAAFLLVVATFIPEVTTTTFRRSNHLAFVARGGADKGPLEATHSSATSIPTSDLGPKVNGDETKDDADLDKYTRELQNSGNDDDDAERNEIECVGDACTMRGGADVPETNKSLDQVGEGEDSPSNSKTNEEQGNNIDDVKKMRGDDSGSSGDPTTVRGGADEPESTDSPELSADDSGDKLSTDGDVDDEVSDKKYGEENSGGDSGESVGDSTSVRGGADEPESTDSPDPNADNIAEKSSIDGDIEGGASEQMDDDENSGGKSGENVGDSTSVRGGADEPELNESPDPKEAEGGEESPIHGNVEDEAVDKTDDEAKSGGDSGENPGDSTSFRGGADEPESTQAYDPRELGGDEKNAIDDEVNKETVESVDNYKNTEGGEDESMGAATSVRGGAKDVSNSPDFAEEDEYEYENDGELEVEGEEGQYDGVEDEFYEEDDEFGVRETANVIRKEEILIDDETEEFLDQNPIIEVAPEFGHQHATDDDSSAFVDRDELADAYDDDEAFVGATSFRAGHTDDDDRASIDDVPGTEESAGTQVESLDDADVVEQDEGEDVGENIVEDKALESALEAISKEVEQILINECGFRKSELRGMKPQIANLMAEKRLRRPQEGIPDSWYEEKKKGLVLATLAKVLSAVIPLALGALVVFGDIDFSKLLEGLRKSEFLIGVQEEKPRKDDSELTIPGTETEDDFEEKIVEEPEPAPSNMNRLFRFRRSGAQVPTNN